MATMDPRYLGAFMLLSTQINWVHDLLPSNGSKPGDFTKTLPYEAGLNEEFLGTFYDAFNDTGVPDQLLKQSLANLAASKTKRDVYRQLFEVLSVALSNGPVNYSPPPCPAMKTLQYIINAVNSAPAHDDTLDGGGRPRP